MTKTEIKKLLENKGRGRLTADVIADVLGTLLEGQSGEGSGGGSEGVTIDLTGYDDIMAPGGADVTDAIPEGYHPSTNDVILFGMMGSSIKATGWGIIDLGDFGVFAVITNGDGLTAQLKKQEGRWTFGFMVA